ncbi:MAG: isochorismate synthase [Candidatus Omnitrophica bacterium]|nr:isochorismate synthase [Candidatus Omnitrophota bacterium]
MTMLLTKNFSLSQAIEKLIQELNALDIQGRLSSTKIHTYRVKVSVEDIDLLAWIHAQENAIKIYWEDREKNFAVAGIGAADMLIAKTGEDPYEILSRIQKNLSPNFPDLNYYGGFCFNSKFPLQGEWKNWSLGRFVLPLIEIRKSGAGTILACNIFLNRNFSTSVKLITSELNRLRETINKSSINLPQPWKQTHIPDELTWKATAAHIINSINETTLHKVVFARSIRLDFKDTINPFFIMSRLRETTSNCFSFIFQFQEGEIFLGASPERLYQRTEENIETEAVAGTRPRGQEQKEDASLQSELLSSAKDNKEQNFVVDMIHKNLLPLCTSLNADTKPSLLNWSAGHHLITRFNGRLKKNIKDKILLSNLHPTAAIAGTPAALAVKTITQMEVFDRGWYSGPIGYVGFKTSEFAVAIRSALMKGNSLHLYAGAGLIRESSPDAEWEETENKLTNFLKVFNATES